MTDKKYWEEYYERHAGVAFPSPFAKFVLSYLKKGETLMELGCGNGRDSIFFSKCGLKVLGIDQCENIVADLNKNHGNEKLQFQTGDFTKVSDELKFKNVYSRFSLHSVNKESANETLQRVFRILEKGGLFFIEVRSVKDDLYGIGKKVEPDAWIDTHYRRFIRYDEIVTEIKNIGYDVIYSVESKGLAKYKEENPVVIRIVAMK